MRHRILIADDEMSIRELLIELLQPDYDVSVATTGDEAWEMLRKEEFQLALLDMRMPGLTGMEVIQNIKNEKIPVMVIFITADKDIQNAIDAIKLGAFDYVTKPFDNDKIMVLVKNALDKLTLEQEIEELRNEVESKYSFDTIIGKSSQMNSVFQILRKVITNVSTVLLTGESGTGKELVAKAIHYNGLRKKGPFVAVDCAAIPDTLIENELFGHERGAFTGALIKKIGKFEMANKGTLFLDEIGNLKQDVQAKLLRVLQEFEFERVGSNTKIKVDIRLIAATNADLEKKIREGSFREDLYYRLNVVNITLPPLRDREGDIVILAHRFLEEFNKEYSKSVKFKRDILDRFLDYRWPGNVRELRNVVQRLVVINDTGEIEKEDLSSQFFLQNVPLVCNIVMPEGVSAGMTLEDMEKVLIKETIRSTNRNLSKTARILGITRKTLHNKLGKFPELLKDIPEKNRGV